MNKKPLLNVVALCVFGVSNWSWAADSTTPKEIVDKTKEAAAMVADKGEEGLKALNDKEGAYVWKDTYVFAVDCEKKAIAAHPVSPNLISKSTDEIKDKKGNAFFDDLCAVAQEPNGGWVEYWWSKPGAEGDFRKISYMIKVDGTPYAVGAGVYDEEVTVDELNAMLK